MGNRPTEHVCVRSAALAAEHHSLFGLSNVDIQSSQLNYAAVTSQVNEFNCREMYTTRLG